MTLPMIDLIKIKTCLIFVRNSQLNAQIRKHLGSVLAEIQLHCPFKRVVIERCMEDGRYTVSLLVAPYFRPQFCPSARYLGGLAVNHPKGSSAVNRGSILAISLLENKSYFTVWHLS
jgi:hypothetical protein